MRPEYRLLGESELLLTISSAPVDDREKLREIVLKKNTQVRGQVRDQVVENTQVRGQVGGASKGSSRKAALCNQGWGIDCFRINEIDGSD